MKVKTIGNLVDRRLEFTFDGLEPVQFNADNVASALHLQAEMHGWEQRLRDCAAGKKTESERRDAVKALVDHYHSGSPNWTTRTAAAPSPVIAALATKWACTYAEAEARVANELLGELGA